jgi:hypothetical protein
MKGMSKLETSLVACLLGSVGLIAADFASLAGRVSDASGAALPGTQVILTRPATGYRSTLIAGDEGRFAFPPLPPGEYQLEASRQGFQTVTRSLTLNVSSRLNVEIELPVGATATTVEVRSTVMPLERETAAVETLFDRTFVQNLPLNGRSFQSLLELTPGVVLTAASITNQGQFAVNGQRTNGNYFLIDGVSANVAASASAQYTQQAAGTLPGLNILGGSNGLVSVDALQEFRVQTSSMSAEYGRTPGGQIQVITRSGTNQYTGSLYNYFRNEKLDANDWFANSIGQQRLALRQNNFGGTLGGPVWLPGVYNGKDRTFFFFSYEGLRMRQPQNDLRTFLVPSALARQQATGAVKTVLEAFPLPNAPLLPTDRQDPRLGRYQYTQSIPSEFDAISARLDQRTGSQGNAFFRFNISPSARDERAFANQANAFESNLETYTAGYNYAFNPRLFADVRANWSRSEGLFLFEGRKLDGAVLPPEEFIFPPGLPRENTSVSLQIVANPATSLTQGRSLGNVQRQFNLVSNLTWNKGAHQVKFGVDWRLLRPAVEFRSLGVSYNFTTRANSIGIIDLLETGRVTVNIQGLAPVADFRLHNTSWFVQDTWRLSRAVTLTLGLRHEINPPPGGSTLPYTLNSIENLLQAQLAPPNTRLYKTQWGNFAPRAGIAWRLNRSGDFVFRAGSGIFYDLGSGPALRGYTSFPFNSQRTLTNVPFPVPASEITASPFNTNPPYNATFYVMDPNLNLPYTVHWNATLEKGLGNSQMISLAYVGNTASRLLRTEILRNITALGQPQNNVINPNLFAPTASVFLTRNASESNYHSLQVQFQRRMAKGLQAMASYTWSKAIDNMSDEATAGLPAGGIPGFNVALDREFAPANFDLRHVLTAAVTWEMPYVGSGFGRALTRGWALDSILRLRTGFPVTVITQAIDPLNFGTNRRVDYLGGPVWIDDPKAPSGRRLNSAVFRVPVRGEQGSLGRNSIRGLGAQQLDLALRREFSLRESLRLQFRVEAFNLTNHPNFGLPSSSFGIPQFGLITSMLNRSLGAGGTSGGLSPLYQVGGPRSLQLSMRILF